MSRKELHTVFTSWILGMRTVTEEERTVLLEEAYVYVEKAFGPKK